MKAGGTIAAAILTTTSCGTGVDRPDTKQNEPQATVSATASASDSDANWMEIDGNGFTARMPGTPERSVHQLPLRAGELRMEMFLSDADDHTLIIQSARLPIGVPASLDDVVAGAARASQMVVMFSTPDSLRGMDARYFQLVGESPGGSITLFGEVTSTDQILVLVLYGVDGRPGPEKPSEFVHAVNSVAFDVV